MAGRFIVISRKAGLRHAQLLIVKTNIKIPYVPPFFFPVAFIMRYDIIWCETSLWSVGVSCQGCGPRPPSCTPSLITLVLCKDSSAVTKTSLHYQHCFGCKPKTKHHASYYEENSLHSQHNTSVHHSFSSQFWQMLCNQL